MSKYLQIWTLGYQVMPVLFILMKERILQESEPSFMHLVWYESFGSVHSKVNLNNEIW